MGDRKKLLDELNELIKNKEAAESEQKKAKVSKPTRAAVNRENGAKSQGPVTPDGKQRASANSLKHGFFASVEKLNPQDAPVYQHLVYDLRRTLHPDNPVEELAIRELAMLSARLQRIEAAEYALLCSEIEAHAPTPPKAVSKSDRDSDIEEPDQALDSRSLAAAFLNTQDAPHPPPQNRSPPPPSLQPHLGPPEADAKRTPQTDAPGNAKTNPPMAIRRKGKDKGLIQQ